MGSKLGLTSVALLLLAGCGDPLRDVDRLSSVEVAPEPAQVEIAAASEKQPPEGGMFAGLFGKRKAEQKTPDPSEAVNAPTDQTIVEAVPAPDASVVSAPKETSDAVDDLAKSEQSTATAEPVAEVKEPVVRQAGLFGLFRRANPPADVKVVAKPQAEPDPAISAENGARLVRPETLGVSPEAARTEPVQPAPKPKRRGLFGGFGAGDDTQTAAKKPKRRRGRVDPNAPDAAETTLENVQPFGAVARLCDQPHRALGKEVARYPERGRGYRLIDSKPGSVSPRSFYITGFKDGCARQFTAALAIFGSPGMHEQLRYGLPAKIQPYSNTDKAYEKVKSKICRVGRKKPCGDKLGKLEKNTVFVSYYERFGGNARWANFLLHNGKLEAKDIKSK